ncbi:quorum-sensing autoinducer CAI-1 synthase [Schlegelella sp. S2-27]|uniref:Quorum-sensing autoinducer CAI-1 synthase n=1 Tax=Caldimonas mangrovi TaxID=2944811 RepID=A0ABT0YT96_9BURK|nr:alpha-hydroxyketone-type quorum-sensing autoinducer synthase [Caldimonas mangrovi]MCM5681956.1 quorum-sensing autoinducer CAI-1 synthase [Caldimonas mangrovi]
MTRAATPNFLDQQIDRFFRKRFFDHPEKPGLPFWYSVEAPASASLSLQSNDYLSLAEHPHIVESTVASLRRHSSSSVMSPIFVFLRGGATPSARFEERLAQYVGMDAGILCQSGYDANVGLLQVVAQKGLPVYIDQYAHASLWQGIHAAEARAVHFKHNDTEDLRRLIVENGPGVIVVDSVYSTSGSVCPLARMADMAEEFGCVFVVDESHSLGTHGAHGEGLVHTLGLSDRVHFITSSLAKAFAYRAGFIACSERYVEYIRFTAFPAIFSSTLLEHEVARLDATLDVIASEPDRRTRLWRNTRLLRDGMTELGYDISNGTEQIIGIRSGPVLNAVALRDAMERRGIYGSLFWYPATEWRNAILRLTVNAGLNDYEIGRVLEAMEYARPFLKPGRGAATRPSAEARDTRETNPAEAAAELQEAVAC